MVSPLYVRPRSFSEIVAANARGVSLVKYSPRGGPGSLECGCLGVTCVFLGLVPDMLGPEVEVRGRALTRRPVGARAGPPGAFLGPLWTCANLRLPG